ncbi:MAG: hypothetical protein EOO77_25175 [Oxalobacteraceae bacterium]|nr:MAG: hypothetical protein EOO77_25175 [Oxalobacteraceae bacterium]
MYRTHIRTALALVAALELGRGLVVLTPKCRPTHRIGRTHTEAFRRRATRHASRNGSTTRSRKSINNGLPIRLSLPVTGDKTELGSSYGYGSRNDSSRAETALE